MFGKRSPANVATPPAAKPSTSGRPPGQNGAPKPGGVARPAPSPPKPGSSPGSLASKEKIEQFNALKMRLHRKLIDQLDLTRMVGEEEDLRVQVKEIVSQLADQENTLLNFNERQRLIGEVLDETFGLGPLEVLLGDETISDILVNGPKQVYVERRGNLALTEVQFRDNAHLMHVIDKIVSAVGRRCDETSPLVDARLADGSRVNAVIPP